MQTFARKCLFVLLMACAVLSSVAATDAPSTEQLERFYHPVDVMTLNGCTYFVQSFIPTLQGRLKAALQRGADKRATVKALLAEYDGIQHAMCAEVKIAFQENPEYVAWLYRINTYFSGGAISGTIASREAKRWSADNAAFSRKSENIPALYYLAVALGREFIDWPTTDTSQDAHEKLREVERESKRCGAGDERKLIFEIANDRGFASILPSHYDMPALALEEMHLRRECKRLGLEYVFGTTPVTSPVAPIDLPAEARGLAFVMKLNAMFERYKSRMQEKME
jgi:hypothetical protein